MMQTAQMLLSELVDKVSKCSKNRLEMQMVGADVAVSRFMSPAEAGEGDMSFLTDPRYAEAMRRQKLQRLCFVNAMPRLFLARSSRTARCSCATIRMPSLPLLRKSFIR